MRVKPEHQFAPNPAGDRIDSRDPVFAGSAPVTGAGEPVVDWEKVVLVTATVGVFAVATGLSSPLLALVLKKELFSDLLIGANAAMTPIGLLTSALCVPRFAQRVGGSRAAVGFALTAAAALVLMAIFPMLWVWFPARFVLGLAIGGFYIVNKAWLNEIAAPAYRGRIVGIYAAVLAAGFSLGPFALALTGSSGWLPFAVGISALLTAALITAIFARRLPGFAVEQRASVASFLPRAPVLLVAVGVFGLFDQATLAFLPAFGVRNGFSEQTMAVGLALLNAGNVVLQVPIGWLADRFPRRLVLAGCSVAAAGGAVLLTLAVRHEPFALFAFLFVWGACACGVTTVALAELGDRFGGPALLAGSAAFTLSSGVGGMLGGPLTGAAIDKAGDSGLILVLAGAYGLLGLVVAAFPLTRRSGRSRTD
ncbi:MFS transporter [Bradyrhizobium sp. 195]|uniref:MFS transporter n=1 Tax=Bradyrhizobium sp. 195 TaxID=2782662 RepID=UPI002000D4A2|nr:MFS transporter [Bradyrhizobium sp. 195]UPK29464.1 MFS transporter [Bradyrhizobium sp. 195]